MTTIGKTTSCSANLNIAFGSDSRTDVSITNVLIAVALLVDFALLLTASGETVLELDDFDLGLELAGTGSPSMAT